MNLNRNPNRAQREVIGEATQTVLRVHQNRVLGNLRKLSTRIVVQEVNGGRVTFTAHDPPVVAEDWENLQSSLKKLVTFIEEKKHELGNQTEALPPPAIRRHVRYNL